MPREVRRRFRRTTASGLARPGKKSAHENHGERKNAGRFVGVSIWPGAGVLPGLRQRGTLQSALGTAVWRRTASHSGGAFQGVCPCGRCCLSKRCENFGAPSQLKGKV